MKKLLYLKDYELKQYIEKIFTGYRETVSDAKVILDKYSIGVAHNKVLHLISLYEGITISDLLRKLNVTKQSLNRVLKDLIKLKAINYKKDEVDTRIKHVYLTEDGEKIYKEIFYIQKRRIHKAFLNSNPNEVVSFDKVLKKLLMENYRAHILVVDDDDGIRNLVKEYLNNYNYLVSTASNAEDAAKKVEVIKFDLIILDIMMPGKSGLEFTLENKNKIDTPIILLTAKGEASDRVEGLEIGADDYLPKPFEPKELILRIKNILKKTKKNYLNRIIEFGNIKIDINRQFIYNKDKSIKINNTEKKILSKMINSPGKIFKRDEIGKFIDLSKERSIDVIITRLRKKIEEKSEKSKIFTNNKRRRLCSLD